jgi:hypothetical protein
MKAPRQSVLDLTPVDVDVIAVDVSHRAAIAIPIYGLNANLLCLSLADFDARLGYKAAFVLVRPLPQGG